MRRRDLIVLLGGAAIGWIPARAQQSERVRRVGVLMTPSADSSQGQARVAAFQQALRQLGWIDGTNVRIDTRWGDGDANKMRRQAAELAALGPDVILSSGSALIGPLLQATRTVPIVFVTVADPVGAGVVDSLARPGGNATGFLTFDYNISAKWLELLKEIVPSIKRVAVVRDPTTPAGAGQWGAIQTAAPLVGVEVSPVNVGDASEMERAIAAFAGSANGGMVVQGSPFVINHPDVIVALAARYKLPAVYYGRYLVDAGGLVSYGPDLVAQYRRAADYVDRILKGERPADLPVQGPTKYELVINLKTAKALSLTVPPALTCARKRGNRITSRFCPRTLLHLLTAALGTKGEFAAARQIVRLLGYCRQSQRALPTPPLDLLGDQVAKRHHVLMEASSSAARRRAALS